MKRNRILKRRVAVVCCYIIEIKANWGVYFHQSDQRFQALIFMALGVIWRFMNRRVTEKLDTFTLILLKLSSKNMAFWKFYVVPAILIPSLSHFPLRTPVIMTTLLACILKTLPLTEARAKVTWDQAQIWFRLVNNIPAGKAKPKENF